MLFLLTAVRSNIVSDSPLIRPDWKQTPSFSGPVIHFLCFLPFHFLLLFCSVSLFSEPRPNTQTHNLSLLATAGWHHVCACGWRDSVLAYISVYVWLERVREKLWHLINALRTSLGTSWLDSRLCVHMHTHSHISSSLDAHSNFTWTLCLISCVCCWSRTAAQQLTAAICHPCHCCWTRGWDCSFDLLPYSSKSPGDDS